VHPRALAILNTPVAKGSQRARKEKSSAHLSGTTTLTVSCTRELEFPSKLTAGPKLRARRFLVQRVDPRLSLRNRVP
jgi:hypothetical protein